MIARGVHRAGRGCQATVDNAGRVLEATPRRFLGGEGRLCADADALVAIVRGACRFGIAIIDSDADTGNTSSRILNNKFVP